MSNEKGALTVAEAGKRGGDKVKAMYGPEFYEQIGRKGGAATKARHGSEHFEKIGKKGGEKVAKRGREHFVEIGTKGGNRLKELIARGKASEAEEKGEA